MMAQTQTRRSSSTMHESWMTALFSSSFGLCAETCDSTPVQPGQRSAMDHNRVSRAVTGLSELMDELARSKDAAGRWYPKEFQNSGAGNGECRGQSHYLDGSLDITKKTIAIAQTLKHITVITRQPNWQNSKCIGLYLWYPRLVMFHVVEYGTHRGLWKS